MLFARSPLVLCGFYGGDEYSGFSGGGLSFVFVCVVLFVLLLLLLLLGVSCLFFDFSLVCVCDGLEGSPGATAAARRLRFVRLYLIANSLHTAPRASEITPLK